MGAIRDFKVEQAINKNATLKATFVNPSTEQQAKLVEGKDIVVPLFDGIVFSGAVTRVTKRQLTPDVATTHYYQWEIEATSDLCKLGNITLDPSLVANYLNKTPGQLLEEFLPADWLGWIDVTGTIFSFTSLGIDIATLISDLINQTGYDTRTRRDYERYACTDLNKFSTYQVITVSPAEPWDYDDLIGSTIMFVTGKSAYIAYGTILDNAPSWIKVNMGAAGNDVYPGDTFIVIKKPVLDYQPSLSSETPDKTLVINKTLLKFESIDDKSSRFTKIVCVGRSHNGQGITSTLAACRASWNSYAYTTYRSESVLHVNVRQGDSVFVVKGHSFKPNTNEYIGIYDPDGYDNYKVLSATTTTHPDGTPVTVVSIDSGVSTASDNFQAGTPVYYHGTGAKIYVSDKTKLSSPIWIGDEKIEYTSTGTDGYGDYVTGLDRGKSGGSQPYDHPMGVIIRNNVYNESNPEDGSPVDEYGIIVRTVRASTNCSRGDLDRLCTTMLPRGSNITNTGEGIIPIHHFWKLNDEAGDTGYVPLEVGDLITLKRGTETVGNYVLMSYTLDFDRMYAKVRLGDYEENIVFKIQDLYNTITRQLS